MLRHELEDALCIDQGDRRVDDVVEVMIRNLDPARTLFWPDMALVEVDNGHPGKVILVCEPRPRRSW